MTTIRISKRPREERLELTLREIRRLLREKDDWTETEAIIFGLASMSVEDVTP